MNRLKEYLVEIAFVVLAVVASAVLINAVVNVGLDATMRSGGIVRGATLADIGRDVIMRGGGTVRGVLVALGDYTIPAPVKAYRLARG